jgi:hypothetical protein
MGSRSQVAAGCSGRGGFRALFWALALACALTGPTIAGASSSQSTNTCFGSPATILGTEGNDQINGTAGPDVIVALGGNDVIASWQGGPDKICGGDGSDTILGGPGNDEIDGGAGGDPILGGLGDDRLIGGADTDSVAYIDSSAGVRVNLANGTGTGPAVGNDTISEFEAIFGSPHADVLEGDDFLNIFFPDEVSTVPRGSDDVIRGGAGLDVVLFQNVVQASLVTRRATGEGNDQLLELEGLSAIPASSSNLVGDGRDNFIMGGAGRDVVDGGGGDDSLVGLAGNDQLRGGGGADIITGGGGNDALDAGAGQDLLAYLDFTGRVTVDLASRRASGEGTDAVRGFEIVAGTQNADVLRGDATANTLQGKGGNDRLEGRGGDDFLDGGGDSDRLTGGPGRDHCLDGERLAGCETRERTAPQAQALTAVVSSLNLARERVQGAFRAADTTDWPATYRRSYAGLLSRSVPLLAGSMTTYAASTPKDRVTYLPYPGCVTRGRSAVTSIRPPKGVQPVAGLPGQQTARWQGLLTVGNRVVYRTPVVESVIAGTALPAGWAVEWREPGSKRLYRTTPRSVTRSRHRWKAELSIVQEQRSPTRHDVTPPAYCPR